MSCNVFTYSPDDVILEFGGYTIEGWNSFKIIKQVPSFRTIQGIGGKNTRVRNKNSHAIIEINVDQVSELNNVLSQITRGDLSSGAMVLYLTLTDKSGGEVFSSMEAYVSNEADRVYDATMQSRTWTIECLKSTHDTQHILSNATSLFSLFNDGSTLNSLFN